MQVNARYYYTISGTAPNGQEIQPSLSYQVGVLWSLRLKRILMGYAGYTYKLDRTEYLADPDATGSRASEGAINSIDIQGNYLNLILEYSF